MKRNHSRLRIESLEDRVCLSQTSLPLTVATGGAKWAQIRNSSTGPSGFGNGFAITDGGLATGRNDAYDGGSMLRVNGTTFQAPGGTVDLTGTTLTTGPATLSNLQTTVQFFFSPTSPTVRALYSFSNSTGSDISVPVVVGTNYGSDNQTIIRASSDGNTTVDAGARWFVSSDSNPGTGDPVNTTVRYGPGSVSLTPTLVQTPGNGNDNYVDQFNLTVPAGQTRELLLFGQFSVDTATAASNAATFDSTAGLSGAGLLAGLSATGLSEIVNWDFSPPGPTAVDDSYVTAEETPLTVNAPGVLANDSAAGGGSLSTVFISGPSHGVVNLYADGSFTYSSAALYAGPDSFIYEASDGTNTSSPAAVNLTVTPPPVAVDDSYTTAEETPLTVAGPGVLGNDSDADGDALTAVLVAGPGHGAVALSPDGSFTYTPAAPFSGRDSFTYKADDGHGQDAVATVDLAVTHVNHPPVAVDDSYTTAEETPLTVAAAGVLGNDSDADGDAFSAVLVTGPSHGALTLNADGSFTYTPEAPYRGPDSFTYKADDGNAQSGAATVRLTVTPINHPPVALDESYTTGEGLSLSQAAPGVLANDGDPDRDPLSAVLVNGPAHGALSLYADGSFTYVPDALFSGFDSFTYQASDGAALSRIATVDLTVNQVYHPATAVDDHFATTENTPLTVAAPGLLANDANPDGNPLTAAIVTAPAHGTLAPNPDGSFTYTPDANYHGPDSFTYRNDDGVSISNLATVALDVAFVDQAPKADFLGVTTAEATPLSVAAPGVLAGATDLEGDALTAVLVDGPAHGTLVLNADGSFLYTPDAFFHGADSFSYRASDGQVAGNVASVALTVTPTDHPIQAAGASLVATQGSPLSRVAAATFTAEGRLPADRFSATIGWGDGTNPGAGTVTLTDGVYTVDGTHVYDAAGTFPITVTIQGPAGDPVVAPSTATVAPLTRIAPPTGTITSQSVAGPAGQQFTNVSTPLFAGSAPAGWAVSLFARQGSAAATLVGRAIAGADGSYRITSTTLADGVYSFSITAADPAPGSQLVMTSQVGTRTVDTTAPQLVGTQLDSRNGRLMVTFRDTASGLDLARAFNAANYQVRGRSSHHPLGITGLQATATSGNDGTTTVALTLNKGHHIQKGPLTLTIPAGAIGDLAGNTLAGPLQTSLGASGAHRNDAAIHASTSGSTALHDLALHHLQGHRHHRATH